jgi:hypothetical protein
LELTLIDAALQQALSDSLQLCVGSIRMKMQHDARVLSQILHATLESSGLEVRHRKDVGDRSLRVCAPRFGVACEVFDRGRL